MNGFRFHDQLGAGSYGQVRACTEVASGEDMAVKIIYLPRKRSLVESWLGPPQVEDPLVEVDWRSMALLEGTLWEQCSGNKYIVNLYSSFIQPDFAFFVMERCQSSLLDVLINDPYVDEAIDSYYCQMLLGVAHVHSKSIIHRDIKHDNFLCSHEGVVKLCDFGLAIRTEAVKATSYKVAGSHLFMSPEMLGGVDYGCSVDIWSLGVAIYVIVFGDFPYAFASSLDGLTKAIRKNNPPPSFKPIREFPIPDPAIVKFVRQLLRRDYLSRKTAAECLQMDPVRKYARGLQRSQSMFSKASVASRRSVGSGGSAVQINTAMKLVRKTTRNLEAKPDPHVQDIIDEQLHSLDPKRPVHDRIEPDSPRSASQRKQAGTLPDEDRKQDDDDQPRCFPSLLDNSKAMKEAGLVELKAELLGEKAELLNTRKAAMIQIHSIEKALGNVTEDMISSMMLSADLAWEDLPALESRMTTRCCPLRASRYSSR